MLHRNLYDVGMSKRYDYYEAIRFIENDSKQENHDQTVKPFTQLRVLYFTFFDFILLYLMLFDFTNFQGDICFFRQKSPLSVLDVILGVL